ncbi:MAG: DUF932 domain-containing protein [Desulfobacter sp.]
MAHELWIDTASGMASMFYVDEEPWHGLGTKLANPATSVEAIKAANLDWEVSKQALFVQQHDGYSLVDNRYAVTRPGTGTEPENVVLGVVGKGYTPLQNREAFAFFDHVVGKQAAIYHTAGALGNGERVWILAKLPGTIQVVGDDVTDKYLLLSNSHDGSSAVQVKFTPIRVVCNNTLTMALSEGETIRVPHTQDVRIMLQRTERALGIINRRYNDISQVFKAMARHQINQEKVRQYLARVFPTPNDPADQYGLRRSMELRALAELLFDQGKGNRMHGVGGTLWAAYNGVTELIDHRQTKQTPDQRLTSIWYGDGYLTKARAYREASTLLKKAA